MPDTAGAGDPHIIGVGSGTLPGRAAVVRDGGGTGTGGAALTGTPGGPTTPRRKGREG